MVLEHEHVRSSSVRIPILAIPLLVLLRQLFDGQTKQKKNDIPYGHTFNVNVPIDLSQFEGQPTRSVLQSEN